MAYDVTSADLFGGTSTLLSQRDMSDDENLKDARFEFERATDDFQLARWARRWGLALLGADGNGHKEDLEQAYEDANEAEKRATDLGSAIKHFVAEFDGIVGESDDPLIDRINDLVGKLEGAL